MVQDQPPEARGSNGAYMAGVVWCLAGLGLTAAAIASAFIQVRDKTPLATSLFVVAFLMSIPAILAIMITQISRYGSAVQRFNGVWVPMRGPHLLGQLLIFGTAALVALPAIVGHADRLWNSGGWSLVVAVWPALVFLAGLDVLNGASYPD